MGGHKRSPWDSLPSLRQDSSLNDSGYKSNRADSFEQRGVFDRQDSLRSDYMSDREPRYGIVQQASIDSTDSRLCYLTSSEVSTDSDFLFNLTHLLRVTAAQKPSSSVLTCNLWPSRSFDEPLHRATLGSTMMMDESVSTANNSQQQPTEREA
nr:protein still life, isoform SIF type 1-like [Aedes albopictus]